MNRIRSAKAEFAVEFIDLPLAAETVGAVWEDFQLELLNNETRFGIDLKSRQIAWSFSAALDAFSDSRVNGGGCPYVFVSINQEEANEKIRYLKAIIAATDKPVRPKQIVSDSLTRVELDDGTRFISHPCRPARGKARTRVYLDEMAHYPNDLARTIYTGALPATTRGDGYIRCGSSPLGASGLFWEIHSETLRRWPGFKRGTWPWWTAWSLCKDPIRAMGEAPGMPTEERVRAFGRLALVEIFENMFLEDFQQEYECLFADDRVSWISWDLISDLRKPDLLSWHAHSPEELRALLPVVKRAIVDAHIEELLFAGTDVGRKRDLTEVIVVGRSTSGGLPTRLSVSLDRVKYAEQEQCLVELLDALSITLMLVDRNGIGSQLAENLEDKRPGRVRGVDFTIQSKEAMAVEARLRAEDKTAMIPMDRGLAYQIHSVKRKITDSKNVVFDVDQSEKHHADRFWAWALALWGAKNYSGMAEFGTFELAGYRG